MDVAATTDEAGGGGGGGQAGCALSAAAIGRHGEQNTQPLLEQDQGHNTVHFLQELSTDTPSRRSLLFTGSTPGGNTVLSLSQPSVSDQQTQIRKEMPTPNILL